MGLLSFLGVEPVKDTAQAIGNLAKDLRSVITGEKTEEERLKIEQIAQQLDLAQIEVNKIEAANPNIFVSGWRPFIGWSCGLGVIYALFIWPILYWIADNVNWTYPPQIDVTSLITMVVSLLGLGGLRTFEKIKGIAK